MNHEEKRLYLIRELLKKTGHNLWLYTDGAESEKLFSLEKFSTIISPFNIPVCTKATILISFLLSQHH